MRVQLIAGIVSLAMAMPVMAGDKIITGKQVTTPPAGENTVIHRCLTPETFQAPQDGLVRKSPWSLPSTALAAEFDTTIKILVLRVNFQYETVDNPNTTGRGTMDLSAPLANPTDSAAYYNAVGHWIDPPPHDSLYFDAHLRALRNYWETASEGRVTLQWEIFPPVRDSVYQLPHPMSYYGPCEFIGDSVVAGLERFYVDCIHTADSADIKDPNHPDIDFSQYQSIIIFHAGSDRQNDIGFPQTCSDLFTGFIRFGEWVLVNGGIDSVQTAVLMPETSSQDNRATALNAVLAHEFGHQLGLVDLYSTANFLSQLGDFSLMDNNGFGTGIDFGFATGKVFGAIPIFPDAWSRAYLGYVPVQDYRQGSDIRVVAAEIASEGLKVARVPISENEFYLIENRLIDTDNKDTYARVDSATNVILGPIDINRNFTGEYDFLMPGSGMLIYHIDEGVIGLDYDQDGLNNFDDNDLQWDPDRRFVSIVEGDGITNFGGYYRLGFGKPEDMYREDRNSALTPNTNPPAIDNSGNNTHVNITDIRRDTITLSGQRDPTILDTVMRFDVTTDRLADGFPMRVGPPVFGLNPIADDIDRDGELEIIAASGNLLSVMTLAGGNFLKEFTNCSSCPLFYDSAKASVHPGQLQPVPLYRQSFSTITAGPVTGDYSDDQMNKLVAFGFWDGAAGAVLFLTPADLDLNGQADEFLPRDPVLSSLNGAPLALSFGDVFYALTDDATVYRKTALLSLATSYPVPDDTIFHGMCRLGDGLVLLSGDQAETNFRYLDIAGVWHSHALDGNFIWGPITVDLDRDGKPEVVAFSSEGEGVAVTVDTAASDNQFAEFARRQTGHTITVNPIAGDTDNDGFAEIIVGGVDTLFAFTGDFVTKTDFPVRIDERFAGIDVIAAPVMADIATGVVSEIAFPTENGNVYSFGVDEADLPIPGSVQVAANPLAYHRTAGFPLPAGEIEAGSPVVVPGTDNGYFGYTGADGWFYLWEFDKDSNGYWPMGGHDPSGSFALPSEALGTADGPSVRFAEELFYSYPNPVTEGQAMLRYTLGDNATRVSFAIFDLMGEKIAELDGSIDIGENEQPWDCHDVTPGVYRCRITVEFPGETVADYTDIAIIR